MLIRHSQGYIPLKYMFPFLEIEEDNIYLTGLSKDNHCCENFIIPLYPSASAGNENMELIDCGGIPLRGSCVVPSFKNHPAHTFPS